MDPKKVLMKDKVPVSPYIGAIGKTFGRNTGKVYYRIIDLGNFQF